MTSGRYIIYLTILILFISAGCAKQSTPTGGPRDEDPPVVVREEPPNGTTFFNGNSFEVTFDEFIVLDNVQQKLLVSPPLQEQPEIKIRRKTLHVEFEEELNEDMTYTFYFQDAIKDLNESNAYDNFQYVFSTGATLDSLSVTGNIYNAFDLNPGQEILVMLFHPKTWHVVPLEQSSS